MSLMPWFSDLYCPPRTWNRSPAIWREPEDVIQAFLQRNLASPLEDLRNLKSILQDTGAVVNSDKDKFQANIDVQQFKPDEISVKVTGDNTVTVEGKHEEQQDEHGFISRHFVRKYVIPENYDTKKIQSKLSSDGVLTITAPKVDEGKQIEYREIPITRTGQPMKRIEQKEEPKK